MNIRLTIAAASNPLGTFEHAGPVIRIGRDADCDLALQGQASTGVSRQHARIEMSTQGATIEDAGSSNGTLLNGKMVVQPTPLRVGDQIWLGYTGPTLTVAALDLGKPLGPRAGRLPIVWLAAAGAAAGLLLVVGIVAIAVLANQKPKTPEYTQTPPPETPEVPAVNETRNTPPGPVKPPPNPPPAPPDKPESGAPSVAVQKVGSYVALEHWLSVLVRREGEDRPWAVLPPEANVATAQTLVSLPGYRSLLVLDSGVHLVLWGNLPEFSPSPPVLESVVMLNEPAAGIDVDFTLDRGRVVLANHKSPPAPARIRLRFLREVWDLELPNERSEVAVELWSPPPERATGPGGPRLSTCLGVFARGSVLVKTAHERRDLTDRSRLSWVNTEPSTLYSASLPQLPDWWIKPLDRKAPAVQKALRSLLDWSERLGGPGPGRSKPKPTSDDLEPLRSRIKKQVQDVKDPDNQDVGVLFLAALDEVEPLVDLLSAGEEKPNVRSVARLLLQSWLGRSSDHAEQLAQILERRGTARDEAELILRLLYVYPPESVNDRKTYEELVRQLDNGNLLVRDLSFWQLDQLGLGGHLPKEARQIAYDPAWDADKRKPAIDRWNKLLADGKLPVRR